MTAAAMRELGHVVLVAGGAMGSCLRGQNAVGEDPVELLNLRRARAVKALHDAYRAAGARVLVTNTFAANRVVFGDAGLERWCEEANRAGVALARAAADPACAVWGSVGPLGLGLRLDDYAPAALLEIYREQCEALRGADALLLETFVEVREARAALAAAAGTGLPVVFEMGDVGHGAHRWHRVEQLLREALRAGVAVVGANCQHPDSIAQVMAYLGGRTDLPLAASPNAGQPRIERGRVRYAFSADDFLAAAETLAAMGVAVVGGCCGTTPDHIRGVARALERRPVVSRARASSAPPRVEAPRGGVAAAANPVRAQVRSSRFLVSVEIRADRAQSMTEIVDGAAHVAAAGADFFDVPDNPGATVGRDAMVTSARLQQALGVPAICHMGVTQSNLMRLHSSLLGCWDSGLHGLLAVTGDAPSMGSLGNLAHRVADLRSSVELLRLVRTLREGRLITGEGVSDAPDFCAGCAFGRPVPAQRRWIEAKIEAGAEFVFTQPVFTPEAYATLRDALAGLSIRVFPGIMPLVSHRSAALLAGGRIPGIEVPPEIVKAFARYEAPADQRRFGIEQATRLAVEIAPEATGLYLIMPFGRRGYEETACLVRHVRDARPG